MKKTIIGIVAVALCLVVLGVWFLFRNHDDLGSYMAPKVEEATLQQLLSAPYVTEGSWEFIESWTICCKGGYSDPILAPGDTYLTISQNLQQILKDQPLRAVPVPPGIKNYDKYICGLLDENIKDIRELPLFIRLSAGTLSASQLHEGDVKPTGIRLCSLDETTCYIVIGYRTEPEHTSADYVFYTDDPAVVQALFAFAQTLAKESA